MQRAPHHLVGLDCATKREYGIGTRAEPKRKNTWTIDGTTNGMDMSRSPLELAWLCLAMPLNVQLSVPHTLRHVLSRCMRPSSIL